MRNLFLWFSLALALPAQTPYQRYIDEYYFRENPTAATAAGIHRYDANLEDYSRAGFERRAAALHRFEAEFEKLAESPDRDLVLSSIRSALLELETIRMWERNPDLYSSGIAQSAFGIISRKFAPAAVRLSALTDREKAMPGALEEARKNLRNPPRIYTEVAIQQIAGVADFFRNDVPKAFESERKTKGFARFEIANAKVVAALEAYGTWLRNDLLGRSNGDFRLGGATYSKKLLYDEMVDIPLNRLLEIGYADLRRNQKMFAEVAAQVDPKKTPQQILAEIQKDHPKPGDLLDAFRNSLGGLRRFIEQHRIITIPSPVAPIVEETPPFMRALTSASMDTPGPFETVAKEGFFNVTLPERDWPADRVENFMEGFNRGTILSTAIHEAYPGHYTQFLWMQKVRSPVRKLFGAASNSEGWAHYTEQMMLDEGYAGGNPRARLGQLQDALLRNARYIAGIEMHTGKRSFDEAVAFFEKEGYQSHETALMETKRGTSDPTYLYYTLGKLEILKLREDYRKRKGAAFSLLEFHDRFMQEGFPPIKIVRKALLGDDSPVL